jgi:membrane peptidoglycan carboxypeptidase
VASKTGTTNNSRDAWVIGYTPDIVVGTWAGNNDNTPMVKKVAGLIVAPMWKALMDKILPSVPVESFIPPQTTNPDLKPVLRGDWQAEYSMGGIHNILYWVDKNNPTGPAPISPAADPQYANWEYGVQAWFGSQQPSTPTNSVPTTNTPTYTSPYQYLFPNQTTQPTTQNSTPDQSITNNPYGYIMTPNAPATF